MVHLTVYSYHVKCAFQSDSTLYSSDFAPASRKEFLDIQATIECGITLKYAHDIRRTHSHTQGSVDWHTHINIYLHQMLCACNSYLYYTTWLIEQFTFHSVFSFQKLFTSKSLLIRCYKTRFFQWNTNNTDRNGVNKQNTHTHTPNTQRKITLERVSSMKISDTPFFKATTPILPTPPFLWEKSEPSLFFWKFQKLTPPLFKGGGGGVNYTLTFSG